MSYMDSPQKKICVHMASLKAINIWRYPWDTLVSTPNLHGGRERTFDQKMFFIIQSYFLTFVLSQFITLVFMCELYLLGVNLLCQSESRKKSTNIVFLFYSLPTGLLCSTKLVTV